MKVDLGPQTLAAIGRLVKTETDRVVEKLEELRQTQSGGGDKRIVLDISERVLELLKQSVLVRKKLTILSVTGDLSFAGLEGRTMSDFFIPADTPDGKYGLPLVELFDADVPPNPITDFTEKYESTNPEVFAILNNGDPRDPDGKYHVGKPGIATVNFTVSIKAPDGSDQIVVNRSANFTVGVGGFGTANVGDLSFENLTPVAAPNPDAGDTQPLGEE